jgi:hypothetical protein
VASASVRVQKPSGAQEERRLTSPAGGNDGVDDVCELEFDRRQVVQRTQQHPQEVAGGLDALLGDPGRVEPIRVHS